MIPLQTSHVTEYLGMPFLCSIFKKYADRIDTKYVTEICGNMVLNCLKTTTLSQSMGVQIHWWCHSVGKNLVEVTKRNRNR